MPNRKSFRAHVEQQGLIKREQNGKHQLTAGPTVK
jgi:hypothetical protein